MKLIFVRFFHYTLAASAITVSCLASTQGETGWVLVGNIVFGFSMCVADFAKKFYDEENS